MQHIFSHFVVWQVYQPKLLIKVWFLLLRQVMCCTVHNMLHKYTQHYLLFLLFGRWLRKLLTVHRLSRQTELRIPLFQIFLCSDNKHIQWDSGWYHHVSADTIESYHSSKCCGCRWELHYPQAYTTHQQGSDAQHCRNLCKEKKTWFNIRDIYLKPFRSNLFF